MRSCAGTGHRIVRFAAAGCNGVASAHSWLQSRSCLLLPQKSAWAEAYDAADDTPLHLAAK